MLRSTGTNAAAWVTELRGRFVEGGAYAPPGRRRTGRRRRPSLPAPGCSMSGQRDAGRERGDIWLVGERVMHQALGSLPGQRHKGFDVVAGRRRDRLDCGHGGFGEDLRCRVTAGGPGLGGVSGEDRGIVYVVGGERPPRQSSKHTGLAGGKVHVSVVAERRVEQRPCPCQVTQSTSHPRLTDHGVGRQPRVETGSDRLLVQAVGRGVVALPGPQGGERDKAER